MAALNKTTSRLLRLGGLAVTVGIVIYLVLRVTAFIHIFFDHAGILLTQEEVFQAHHAGEMRSPAVPRITHQIFHNWTHPEDETLPEDWKAARQTCLDTNEGWEHLLWTEQKSRDFIAKEYPWFMHTYSNFHFPVQKIDALRYFLMRHYGGMYIDLDNGCRTSLEPLRYYPAWTTDGGMGALSNNILGAAPNHPYWISMTDSMIAHAWNYPLPYLTISYATGQWYLTKIWEDYHQRLPQKSAVLTRVLMDGRPGAPSWVFFTHTRGGTWDNWDNYVFHWIGEHLIVVAVLVILLCSVFGLTLSSLLACWKKQRKESGYKLVREVP